MEVSKLVPGMVFCLQDNWRPNKQRLFKNEPSRHFYVVLRANTEFVPGFVQAMGITSMIHKEITCEVPILIDSEVSYVTPYNIHSFEVEDFPLSRFKGMIAPGIMSTEKFISFLMELYHCNVVGKNEMNEGYIHHTREKYDDYIKKFRELYPDYHEHRPSENSKLIHASDDGTVNSKNTDVTDPPTKKNPVKIVRIEQMSLNERMRRVENLPFHYAKWADEDLFSTLLTFETEDLKDIIKLSQRFNSRFKIERTIPILTKRLEERGSFLIPCESKNKISDCELFIEVPSGDFKRRVKGVVYPCDGSEADNGMRNSQKVIRNLLK